ncbi:hypothetical protein HKX48_000776 [Thoreauomyces humboldtii]|nr:hypothetical protein HKX48_000776 [Thoreauomyces humboldtii]
MQSGIQGSKIDGAAFLVGNGTVTPAAVTNPLTTTRRPPAHPPQPSPAIRPATTTGSLQDLSSSRESLAASWQSHSKELLARTPATTTITKTALSTSGGDVRVDGGAATRPSRSDLRGSKGSLKTTSATVPPKSRRRTPGSTDKLKSPKGSQENLRRNSASTVVLSLQVEMEVDSGKGMRKKGVMDQLLTSVNDTVHSMQGDLRNADVQLADIARSHQRLAEWRPKWPDFDSIRTTKNSTPVPSEADDASITSSIAVDVNVGPSPPLLENAILSAQKKSDRRTQLQKQHPASAPPKISPRTSARDLSTKENEVDTGAPLSHVIDTKGEGDAVMEIVLGPVEVEAAAAAETPKETDVEVDSMAMNVEVESTHQEAQSITEIVRPTESSVQVSDPIEDEDEGKLRSEIQDGDASRSQSDDIQQTADSETAHMEVEKTIETENEVLDRCPSSALTADTEATEPPSAHASVSTLQPSDAPIVRPATSPETGSQSSLVVRLPTTERPSTTSPSSVTSRTSSMCDLRQPRSGQLRRGSRSALSHEHLGFSQPAGGLPDDKISALTPADDLAHKLGVEFLNPDDNVLTVKWIHNAPRTFSGSKEHTTQFLIPQVTETFLDGLTGAEGERWPSPTPSTPQPWEDEYYAHDAGHARRLEVYDMLAKRVRSPMEASTDEELVETRPTTATGPTNVPRKQVAFADRPPKAGGGLAWVQSKIGRTGEKEVRERPADWIGPSRPVTPVVRQPLRSHTFTMRGCPSAEIVRPPLRPPSSTRESGGSTRDASRMQSRDVTRPSTREGGCRGDLWGSRPSTREGGSRGDMWGSRPSTREGVPGRSPRPGTRDGGPRGDLSSSRPSTRDGGYREGDDAARCKSAATLAQLIQEALLAAAENVEKAHGQKSYTRGTWMVPGSEFDVFPSPPALAAAAAAPTMLMRHEISVVDVNQQYNHLWDSTMDMQRSTAEALADLVWTHRIIGPEKIGDDTPVVLSIPPPLLLPLKEMPPLPSTPPIPSRTDDISITNVGTDCVTPPPPVSRSRPMSGRSNASTADCIVTSIMRSRPASAQTRGSRYALTPGALWVKIPQIAESEGTVTATPQTDLLSTDPALGETEVVAVQAITVRPDSSMIVGALAENPESSVAGLVTAPDSRTESTEPRIPRVRNPSAGQRPVSTWSLQSRVALHSALRTNPEPPASPPQTLKKRTQSARAVVEPRDEKALADMYASFFDAESRETQQKASSTSKPLHRSLHPTPVIVNDTPSPRHRPHTAGGDHPHTMPSTHVTALPTTRLPSAQRHTMTLTATSHGWRNGSDGTASPENRQDPDVAPTSAAVSPTVTRKTDVKFPEVMSEGWFVHNVRRSDEPDVEDDVEEEDHEPSNVESVSMEKSEEGQATVAEPTQPDGPISVPVDSTASPRPRRVKRRRKRSASAKRRKSSTKGVGMDMDALDANGLFGMEADRPENEVPMDENGQLEVDLPKEVESSVTPEIAVPVRPQRPSKEVDDALRSVLHIEALVKMLQRHMQAHRARVKHLLYLDMVCLLQR